MAVDDIVAQLRALDAKELEAVHAHVQVLRALGAGPGGQAPLSFASLIEEDEQYLYDRICKRLNKALAAKPAPYHVFKSLPFYAKFRAVSKTVLDLNAQWFPDQTKTQRKSMLALYVDLVFDYMHTHGWTLYWPSVLKALELLPAIVEREFPGYIAGGTLPLVMKLRTKNNGSDSSSH